MAPPAPSALRKSPERGRRHSRLVVNQAVLAERNPGAVAAVGAWIEAAERGCPSRALISAEEVEEQIIQHQLEKEQRLIRFQGEVKRRVNQHAKQQKRLQLQKSYNVIAKLVTTFYGRLQLVGADCFQNSHRKWLLSMPELSEEDWEEAAEICFQDIIGTADLLIQFKFIHHLHYTDGIRNNEAPEEATVQVVKHVERAILFLIYEDYGNNQEEYMLLSLAREGLVVKQSSDAAMHLTPKRNTCTYRNTQVAIGSPHIRFVSAQKIGNNEEEADENGNRLFKEHSKTLKETMRQVRGRLAAMKTVESEELTLPGGLWKVSPTRDNPISRRSPVLHQPHAEEDHSLLRGYHDLPVELLVPEHEGQTESRMESEKLICNRLMKASYPAGPVPAFNTDYRAALVLRPGADEEEDRKQRQNQYLMYRRLFMDIEREQVKETRRQREHNRKIWKMKRERETERLIEEERLRPTAQRGLENQTFEVALRKEQERNLEHRERAQKTREYNRYVEALRAQMKDKMLLHNAELPPLCCCGSDFWDAHPDTCANNCIFYKNPKAYTRALQSVLSSRDTWDGGSSFRFGNIGVGRP